MCYRRKRSLTPVWQENPNSSRNIVADPKIAFSVHVAITGSGPSASHRFDEMVRQRRKGRGLKTDDMFKPSKRCCSRYPITRQCHEIIIASCLPRFHRCRRAHAQIPQDLMHRAVMSATRIRMNAMIRPRRSRTAIRRGRDARALSTRWALPSIAGRRWWTPGWT